IRCFLKAESVSSTNGIKTQNVNNTAFWVPCFMDSIPPQSNLHSTLKANFPGEISEDGESERFTSLQNTSRRKK
ncbi:hypothetical protein, partial [Porcincola intestinalis]|uniref:hypothetical protein n=1 Tax=Porcincola intestinalis TaxID=2606632 RepID=UPI002A83D353